AIVADLQTAHLDVFQQQVVGFERWDAAGGETDHYQPTAPGERAQGCVEHFATERVENDVGAALVSRGIDLLPQRLAQILPRQVDHRIGAGSKYCSLLLRT